MNKEDYVSLEVAKLLQEKGFREPCTTSRLKNGELRRYDIKQTLSDMTSIGDDYYEFLCPTLYEAQKWLRSANWLHVEVIYMSGDYWIYQILTIPQHGLIGLSNREIARYMSYEYALQAGILEALKLI